MLIMIMVEKVCYDSYRHIFGNNGKIVILFIFVLMLLARDIKEPREKLCVKVLALGYVLNM